MSVNRPARRPACRRRRLRHLLQILERQHVAAINPSPGRPPFSPEERAIRERYLAIVTELRGGRRYAPPSPQSPVSRPQEGSKL